MIYKCANAFYFRDISAIGGIESHFYYMARKYCDLDIVIFYQNADINQLRRLKKYIRCVQVRPDTQIECEKIFCCFNREILEKVIKGEKYLVLHGDYKTMVELNHIRKADLPIDARIDKYLGVTPTVCDSWEEISGIKAQNLFEPIVLDEIDKPIRMIMASRGTREKGFNAIDKFAKAFDDAGINWLLDVYTNWKEYVPQSPNVRILKPRIDISNLYSGYDIAVQLSETEGYGLSVAEALMRGTPVVVTPIPCYKDIGIDESNSVTVPFDMSEVDVDAIVKLSKKRINYTVKEDYWNKVLVQKESNYKMIKVKATENYEKYNISDLMLGRVPEAGEEWEVDDDRYNTLINFTFDGKKSPLVEKIEEIKPKKKTTRSKKNDK